MATKPKASWPMEAPRGFAPAFLHVDQAAAPNGGLCRTLNPRLENRLALKSPGLTPTSACRSPTVASPHLGGQKPPRPTGLTFVCKVPRGSTRLPLNRPRLCLPGFSPFAHVSWRARFLPRLAAAPPGFPLLPSRAQQQRQRRGVTVPHHRRREFFRIFAAPVAPGRSPVRCTQG